MSKGKDLINSIKYGLYRMLTIFYANIYSVMQNVVKHLFS